MKHAFPKLPLACLALLAAVPLAAQSPVPPLIPAPTQSELNRNLTRLAENPRDIDALIGAGEAALKLKDPRAATGFFARADEIDPANGRVKAGLARSMLGVQQPAEALRLFQEAEKLGGADSLVTADRAFAYDLMGNQTRAQADYAAAYRANPTDAEIIRRYAVSLGISGKLQDASKMLDPLLYQSDREAWRDRAFIYAINGDLVEARKITQATMPAEMASAVDPYLQRMTLLTPAQQVAAVHFGQFPSNVMAMAPKPFVAKPPQIASAAGQTRDRETAARPIREPIDISPPNKTAEVRPPVIASRPEVEAARPASNARVLAPAVSVPKQPSPGFQSMAPTPARPATPVAATPVAATPMPPTPAVVSPAAASPPVATRPPPVRIAEAAPLRPAEPVRAPAVDRTLADIFNGIQVPPEERAARVTPVNLDEIAALQAGKRADAAKARADAAAKAKIEAKAKADADAKAKAREEAEARAKAKANPARIWVQIATGRNPDALASDMRKRRKAQDATFTGKTAWTADFGATNRLVIGPFTSTEKARTWLQHWRKSGGEGGYVWNSEKGLEVAKLSEK